MSERASLVLFDLDGTLIDSAPDLAAAANAMRVERGLQPLPLAALRPWVGSGARGMLGAAFAISPDDPRFVAMRDEFLERYSAALLVHTVVFESIVPVLDHLDELGLRWGIVTNKATRFTLPIVERLGLGPRAAVLVCGDTTPHSKPHPAPLLEAAHRAGAPPGRCVYLGDDHRDILAGRAAGMSVLAAAWGYLGQGTLIEAWGADAVLPAPANLLNWLELA